MPYTQTEAIHCHITVPSHIQKGGQMVALMATIAEYFPQHAIKINNTEAFAGEQYTVPSPLSFLGDKHKEN